MAQDTSKDIAEYIRLPGSPPIGVASELVEVRLKLSRVGASSDIALMHAFADLVRWYFEQPDYSLSGLHAAVEWISARYGERGVSNG